MNHNHKYSNEDIRKAAHNVRKHVLRHTIDEGAGFLGQACSSAEIFATLYMRILNIGESLGSPEAELFTGPPGAGNIKSVKGGLYNGPAGEEYDRLFIAPQHYAATVYSVLAECGRISHNSLSYINKDGWKMEVCSSEHSPGYENNGGTLGQTLSIAGGTAHARKLKNESGRVVAFITDGESQEGQVWEAVQTAVSLKLDNLIVFLDMNGQQLEGPIKDILGIKLEDYANRFKAFGAAVVVVDGHDIDALANAVTDTPHSGKPLIVVCRTSCVRGFPFLEHRIPNLHHISFRKDELAEIESFYTQM